MCVIGRDIDFIENPDDPVAAFERMVDLEMELGRILEDDALHEEVLEMLSFVEKAGNDLLLLRLVADDADIDMAALEIWGNVRALNGDKRGGEDDFAADDLAQLAPDDLVDPFETMFHGKDLQTPGT